MGGRKSVIDGKNLSFVSFCSSSFSSSFFLLEKVSGGPAWHQDHDVAMITLNSFPPASSSKCWEFCPVLSCLPHFGPFLNFDPQSIKLTQSNEPQKTLSLQILDYELLYILIDFVGHWEDLGEYLPICVPSDIFFL